MVLVVKKYKNYIFLGVAVLFSGFLFWTYNQRGAECANKDSCIKDLSGKAEENEKIGYFMGKKVSVPAELAQNTDVSKNVLGDSTTGADKHIYIDLTQQKLYAKENGTTVYEFLISSGKWGRTPTGEFTTWIKLQSTRMKGGNPDLGTYYNLPNVPYTMYFYGSGIPKSRGYGIHGAYWHNNFGHPMSHGCINVSPENAKILYDWANPPATGYSTKVDSKNPGTPITIYGVAPPE
ncbi:MAG: L,D-transpeptidase [Patescibacteria group bacterium]